MLKHFKKSQLGKEKIEESHVKLLSQKRALASLPEVTAETQGYFLLLRPVFYFLDLCELG